MIQFNELTEYSGKVFQEALNEAGAKPKLKIDGKIGRKSLKAVVEHQMNNGLILTDIFTDELVDSLGLSVTFSLKKRKTEAPEKDRPDAPDIKPPVIVKPGKHVYKKELWIDGAIIGPNVVAKGRYQTKTGMPIGAVVHFTAGWNKPGNAAKSLERTKYGFHCIDISQGWFQPKNMPLNVWGNHAGTSKSVLKGHGPTSSNSNKLLGIEMNCGGKLTKKGSKYYTWFDKEVPLKNIRFLEKSTEDYGPKGAYEKYSVKQEKDLIDGLVWLCLNDENFHWENIVGHHEIAGLKYLGKWRKNDPGGSLSMSMEDLRQTVRRKVEAVLKGA